MDGGLTPDTSYSYTVSAIDNAGNESPQSAAIVVLTLSGSAWIGSDVGSVTTPGFHSEGMAVASLSTGNYSTVVFENVSFD